ncbi:MAG: SGNH/GDSL hydrolase family protein [Pseudomonadota bacterium]|nr:SGNH/GDSL hydrolase family protein [Pseudomonadota bacterium]
MQLNYRQKIAMTTVLVVLVIVILLGLAEGAVKLRQWLAEGHSGKISDLLVQQGDLRVLIPDARTRTISVNSLGFRGPELAQAKPAGDLRIAFLGGSTTFCAEVSGNDMTWPHLVTEAIQKEYRDISVDYVNAAVPGYTLKSSLLNFRKRVAPLRPDVTIIYHASNDLSWEVRSLAMKQGAYEKPGKERNGWLAEHSQLWYLVVKNLRIKEVQRDALDSKERLEFTPSKLGAQFRKELTQLVIEAKKVSKVVALATFSHQIRPEQTPEKQLIAAGSALYYMPFMTPQGLMASFTRYNQIIAEVASETGAVLIGGEAIIPGDSEHFNDTVHFKDAGSRIMAQRVRGALLNTPEFQTLPAINEAATDIHR